MEIKEEPCRLKDEDTEEQIGWYFPSFSLMTDEEHSDENSLTKSRH